MKKKNNQARIIKYLHFQFVFEQFRVPPKKKRTRSLFHGLGKAIAREEQATMPASSTTSKEVRLSLIFITVVLLRIFLPVYSKFFFFQNNNHSKQEPGTLEESQRRILEGLRTRKMSESTTKVSDPLEIKAKEFDSLLKDGFEAYSLGQYVLAATKYKLALEMLADITLKVIVRF